MYCTSDFTSQYFLDEDACVTPVLDYDEVHKLKHHQDRQAFVESNNQWLPRPAPLIYSAKEFKEVREKNQKQNSKL